MFMERVMLGGLLECDEVRLPRPESFTVALHIRMATHLRHAVTEAGAVALATKADELLLAKQDPKTLARVEEMARRSLRAQALNPTAVRILGYVADARGQHDQARKLILLSEKMSRREFGAQLWLIEDAAARRDYKEALRHYDIALRTTDEASGILFPTLTDALAIPEIRRDFAPYVREWPNWMSGYLSNAIGTSDNPANIADIMLKAGKIRYDKNNAAIADALLAQLAAKGKYAAFRQYYTTLPGARAQSLTTAAFNRDTVNLQHAPAGWQISENPAIGGSFVQKGDSGINQLQAFAGSGERGVALERDRDAGVRARAQDARVLVVRFLDENGQFQAELFTQASERGPVCGRERLTIGPACTSGRPTACTAMLLVVTPSTIGWASVGAAPIMRSTAAATARSHEKWVGWCSRAPSRRTSIELEPSTRTSATLGSASRSVSG